MLGPRPNRKRWRWASWQSGRGQTLVSRRCERQQSLRSRLCGRRRRWQHSCTGQTNSRNPSGPQCTPAGAWCEWTAAAIRVGCPDPPWIHHGVHQWSWVVQW